MAAAEIKPHIGILAHGRDIDSLGWERMMLGEPTIEKMGTLPTLVQTILGEGVENIDTLIIGSGGSMNAMGEMEAEIIHALLLERLGEFSEFASIRNHSAWTPPNRRAIFNLVEQAVLDKDSPNTGHEVGNAVQLFAERELDKVIQVTGLDHGPRCQLVQNLAMREGFIPHDQHWFLTTDRIPFLGGLAVPPIIILEAPHDPSNPALARPYGEWPSRLMLDFFKLSPERQIICARFMREEIDRVGSMNEADVSAIVGFLRVT